jgi:nicotinamidase-related amidase
MEGAHLAEYDYAAMFTAGFRLDRSRAALVVVDMQYATGSREHGLGRLLTMRGEAHRASERFDNIEQMLPKLQRLLAAFREARLPVIHVISGATRADFADVPKHLRAFAMATCNRVGEREHEVLDQLQPQEGEPVVHKSTISAFTSTGIETLLRALGRDQLVFTGISTNMCVDTTARDAAERGFESLLVSDCCTAAKSEYHEAALTTFARLFGRVADGQSLLSELGIPGSKDVA